MGKSSVRVVVGVIGTALLIGGVALGFFSRGALFIPAFWMIGAGIVLVIVALVEITRYRSEPAEAARIPPGPGGGETVAPEPRFQPTDELFVDPTTQQRMRVYADPRTGERRYVAEA